MHDTDTIRLTVREAAKHLGISAEAVRQRISRDTLRHTKIGTTVYVELDRDEMEQRKQDRNRKDQDEHLTALVESQRDQITYLREQLDIANDANREHRRIIAGLIERVPQLPAATQPEQERTRQESREDASQATSKVDHHGPQRPFWKRLFG